MTMIVSLYKLLWRHNFIKNVFFNFYMLPFKQAMYLPFDLYGKVRFERLSGKVVLNVERLKRGIIKIGSQGIEMFPREETILYIEGILVFNGSVEIGPGALIRVNNNASLELGNGICIGAQSKVFCTNHIVLGNNVRISWNCQIFDTNFHYVENMNEHKFVKPEGKVLCGNNIWICNNVTVGKGAVLPDEVTVASHSLCNRNWSHLEPFTVIGGYPAKIIKTDVRRVFGEEELNIANSEGV